MIRWELRGYDLEANLAAAIKQEFLTTAVELAAVLLARHDT